MTKDLDPRSLKEGDKITVEMTVERVSDNRISTTSGHGLYFDRLTSGDGTLRLVSIERAPREFAVGDAVTIPHAFGSWTILAIDEDHAWIKGNDGGFSQLAQLKDLTHA